MYVLTGEAAKLLNMDRGRLRQLLEQGRVFGAYKSGRYWLIPLYDGLPQIEERKRGRKGTWKTNEAPQKTIIHVNSKHIQKNAKRKSEELLPVITVKKGNTNTYVKALEIPFPCRIVYSQKGKSYGAKVWIEVLGVDLIALQPPDNLVS